MRLLEKLVMKRDAAHAEYLKWSGMIETLQTDPDFISVAHHGATRVMKQAQALAYGNGNGNGHGNGNGVDKRSEAQKKAWTPERRAEYSRRMMGVGVQPRGTAKAKKRKNKLTPTQRKASADRLRKRLADPKFKAKRLAGLRKALRLKKAQRRVEAAAQANA